MGLSPKQHGNKLVYAIHVTEKLSFADYWREVSFEGKKPDLRAADPKRHAGDNIYQPLGDGEYRQLQSAHNAADMERDLGGEYVLVAHDFFYFRRAAIALPERFASLKTGRAVKANFPADVIEEFAAFIAAEGFGVHGTPTLWPPKWGAAGGGVAPLVVWTQARRPVRRRALGRVPINSCRTMRVEHLARRGGTGQHSGSEMVRFERNKHRPAHENKVPGAVRSGTKPRERTK